MLSLQRELKDYTQHRSFHKRNRSTHMKIAVLTSGILPVPAVQGGAVENLIDSYLEYNNNHRIHDITVYSIYHPDVKNSPSLKSDVNHYEYVNVNSLWFKIRSKIFSFFHKDEYYPYMMEYFFELVYKKIRKHQYDMFILENRPGFTLKLSCRIDEAKIVSHIHTHLLSRLTERSKKIIKGTTKIISVSEYIKQEIIKGQGYSIIQTVYNGIDDTLFNKNVSPIDRNSIGFSKNDFVVIFTGRLVPNKGIKELLQAMQLLKEYTDIKLLVVGSEDFSRCQKASSFTMELHELSNELADRIKFTGFIPYYQLPHYMASADVMVVPSHIQEAFGMTCIEATAVGLPVIATNDGGIPEALKGQKHILVDKDKNLPESLSKAIIYIKKHQAEFQGNFLPPHFTKEEYAKNFFKAIDIL